MSTTATLSPLFANIEADMEEVDRLFHERAISQVTQLNDASIYVLGSQGKRLRTALTLLTGKMIDYRRDRLIPLSAGFEMLHLASLVHDDIIDRAATRRGLPTVNARFNNDLAILLGDFYFAKTAGLIADVNDNRIDRLFSETVATLVEGAIMEMLDAHHLDLSLDRYLQRISSKTAFLIGACCKGSAIVCAASDEQIVEMQHFGHSLGMAFQIVDDILDYIGSDESIGKPAGNDLRQGMVTLPLIYALEHDGAGHAETVRAIVEEPGQHNDLVPSLVAWVKSNGSIEAARSEARRYAHEAAEQLRAFPAVSEADRRVLEELVDFVLERDR